MEIDHRIELGKAPLLALEPDTLWEIFRRRRDFQHGDLPMRWYNSAEPSQSARSRPLSYLPELLHLMIADN